MPETAMNSEVNNISDVIEDDIRTQMPRILEILLIDRTTSTAKHTRNIIWANNKYKDSNNEFGTDSYSATAQIFLDLITGKRGKLIMPRTLKTVELQKKRTKIKV